jgi:uncharacterized protein YbaP (TraB family)
MGSAPPRGTESKIWEMSPQCKRTSLRNQLNMSNVFFAAAQKSIRIVLGLDLDLNLNLDFILDLNLDFTLNLDFGFH